MHELLNGVEQLAVLVLQTAMSQRDTPEEHDDGHEERHEGYDNNQVDAGLGLLLLQFHLLLLGLELLGILKGFLLALTLHETIGEHVMALEHLVGLLITAGIADALGIEIQEGYVIVGDGVLFLAVEGLEFVVDLLGMNGIAREGVIVHDIGEVIRTYLVSDLLEGLGGLAGFVLAAHGPLTIGHDAIGERTGLIAIALGGSGHLTLNTIHNLEALLEQFHGPGIVATLGQSAGGIAKIRAQYGQGFPVGTRLFAEHVERSVDILHAAAILRLLHHKAHLEIEVGLLTQVAHAMGTLGTLHAILNGLGKGFAIHTQDGHQLTEGLDVMGAVAGELGAVEHQLGIGDGLVEVLDSLIIVVDESSTQVGLIGCHHTTHLGRIEHAEGEVGLLDVIHAHVLPHIGTIGTRNFTATLATSAADGQGGHDQEYINQFIHELINFLILRAKIV